MASKISKTLILLLIIAGLVAVLFASFLFGYNYVRSQDEDYRRMSAEAEANDGNLVTEDTPGAIPIFIPRSSDIDDITGILEEAGFISNPMVFKLMSKFNGYNGSYQAGTHYLLPDMSYDAIMFALTRQPKPLKITFVEGETYLEMRKKMVDSGLNIDVQRMDSLVRNPNEFLDYDFVRKLSASSNREWILQGYLWPDTYWLDPNLDELSILRLFLDNTEQKLKAGKYEEKAASMGMTLDEVMNLASIVQKEGNIEEMSKIGKVFLNRYAQQMPMESCATINYLRGEEGLDPIPWALSSDLVKYRNNAYNTYSFAGLPPGPINNPGTLAIEGVLWPANNDSWPGADSYLYFCATGEGDNVFATSLEEHEANIAYYSAQWYADAGQEAPEFGDQEPTDDQEG